MKAMVIRLMRFGVLCAEICLVVFGLPDLASSARADEPENAEIPAIKDDAGLLIMDDDALHKAFTDKVAALIGEGPDDFVENREEQLQRRTCQLELPALGKRQMSPSEIYQNRIGSVVVVGVFYHCKSKKCKRLHSSLSSGVLIHEDGVVLTNYHVVDVKQPRFLAMAVMTVDGDVFLVDEVLATNPAHDVAAIRLEDAHGLPAASVMADEPVGNPVTLITHPRRHFYSLTSGLVSRYSMGEKTNLVMNITADYAVGSSGGPIFNQRGDLVGLVSSTTSIAARNIRLNSGGDRLSDMRQTDASTAASSETLGCMASRIPEKEHEEDDDVPPPGDEPDDKESMPKGNRAVNIPSQHQMTIKNAVPSRAILALFDD